MSVYAITVKDRQTGKTQVIRVEAKKNIVEAKQIVMKDYGVAYKVK